jgi:hypothetical protein
MGDLLASSDFAATVSVLVLQQYVGLEPDGEELGTPDSPAQPEEPYSIVQMANRSMRLPVFSA